MIGFDYKEIIRLDETSLQKLQRFLDELDEIEVEENNERALYLTSEIIKILDYMNDMSRQLPLQYGVSYINGKDVYDLKEELIIESSSIKIGYINNNWLSIRLPALPPKRKQFHSKYLYEPLKLSLKNFFENCPFNDKRKMVLCYRFVYSKTVPFKIYMDHDNLEIKMLTDLISSYTIKSDAPHRLNNYYCSAQGEETHTEIFLVPVDDFPSWLDYEKSISEKGIFY